MFKTLINQKKKILNQKKEFFINILFSSLILSFYSPIIEEYFGIFFLTETLFVFILFVSFFLIEFEKFKKNYLLLIIFSLLFYKLFSELNFVSIKKFLSIVYSVLFFYIGYKLFSFKEKFFKILLNISYLYSILIFTILIIYEVNDLRFVIDSTENFIFCLICSFVLIKNFFEKRLNYKDFTILFFIILTAQFKIILIFLILLIFLIFYIKNFYTLKTFLVFILTMMSMFYVQKFLLYQGIINKGSDLKYFYEKSIILVHGNERYVGIRDFVKDKEGEGPGNYDEIKEKIKKEEGSINTRISIWLESIKKMKSYNLKEAISGSDFATSLKYRHNFILDILVEHGLVGGLLVIYLLLNFSINLLKQINKFSPKSLTWGFITLFMLGIHFFSLPYYNFKYLAFFSGIFYYSIFAHQKTKRKKYRN